MEEKKGIITIDDAVDKFQVPFQPEVIDQAEPGHQAQESHDFKEDEGVKPYRDQKKAEGQDEHGQFHLRQKKLDDGNEPVSGPVPGKQVAQLHQGLPDIAPLPAQVHVHHPGVGFRDYGVDFGRPLVVGIPAAPQDIIGQGPVFAVDAGRPQKSLVPPGRQDRQEGRPPVSRQGTGGAGNGFVDRLGRPQEVQVDVADPLHLAHEAGVPVVDPDIACHRPEAGILLQRRHQVPQGLLFNDAVRIHRHQDLAPSLGKPGIQPLFFAPVFREANGLDQAGIASPGPVDIAARCRPWNRHRYR